MTWIAIAAIACSEGRGRAIPDDPDVDEDTDGDPVFTIPTSGVTIPTTPPTTDTGTSPWTDWSCAGDGCTWDCTGHGLRLTVPGIHDLWLTADCTLAIEAGGAGGGGGGTDTQGDGQGGGGGGGGSLVLGDDGTAFVIAAGGGGGGPGYVGVEPGGGGSGGHAEDTFTFASGTHLTLVVGGGGQPGCEVAGGAGGAPGGGLATACEGRHALYGGGTGSGAACSYAGNATYGGGGGGNGHSTWGGAGGSALVDCGGWSVHGGTGECGFGVAGGGGGGGGALAAIAMPGVGGRPGEAGGSGGSAVGGSGAGGDGALGCGATAGEDGEITLLVTPGPGSICPVDAIVDCAGACAPSRRYGDGVCDADLDCPALAADGGDCPAVGLQVPAFLTAACPAESAEPTFCLTADRSDLALFGLGSASLCHVAPLAGLPYEFGNVAWPPPYREAYVCDGGVLAEYDLELGGVRYSTVPCTAVTGHQGGLLVKDASGWTWSATFDDRLAEDVVPIPVTLGADTFVASDDAVLYGTGFSSGTLTSADLATGTPRADVPLQDHYGYIDGIEVHRGVLYVLCGGVLSQFEPSTGFSLGATPGSLFTSGLACVSP